MTSRLSYHLSRYASLSNINGPACTDQSLRPHEPFVSLLQLAWADVSQHAQVDRRSGLCVHHLLTDPGQVCAECAAYNGN